MSTQSLRQYRQ